MPKTYEKADATTKQLISSVMISFHKVLSASEVRVVALFVHGGPLSLHGYECYATIKALPIKQRVLGHGDALMMIDFERWEELDTDEKKALIDHELTHLMVKRKSGGTVQYDEKARKPIGEPKLDSAGRPLLMMRLHDWQFGGFREVVDRWKNKSIELQNFRSLQDENGQYLLGYKTALPTA